MITPGFFGLFTARTGIMAAQTALNTVNHNIANVNTPGYSRQRADLATVIPYMMPGLSNNVSVGQVGQGVLVQQITRLHDNLLDSQFRLVSGQQGKDSTVAENLKLIEGIMAEPSDNGISAAMQKFFDSAQDLSLHPENIPARANFLQQGVDLVSVFKQKGQQLLDVQNNLVANNGTSHLAIAVTTVNQYLQQIANLNQQIVTVAATGAQPNDLYDKRDKILDDLSQLVDTTVTQSSTGQVSVSIAGLTMVNGPNVLDTLQLANNPGPAPNPNYVPTLVRTTTGGVVLNDGAGNEITGGQIKGILDAAGSTTSSSAYGELDKLNNLIQSITTEINNLQLAGKDLNGATPVQPIFLPNPPAASPLPIFQYQVNAAVLSSPDLVAAAINDATAPGNFAGVGDGRNALLMAQLKTKVISTSPVPPLNTTYDNYFNTTISQLGVDSQAASSRSENGDKLLQSISLQKQSTSGVNLDDETIDMIRFQRAYEASSKMVKTFDEALQAVLNLI